MADLDGSRDETALVQLANEMLTRLHVPRRVRSCADIDAALFVTLFEGLCAEPLKDAIHDVRTTEDQIHNCQTVIDSLSLDILNTPLSHITGQDVVAGDRTAIGDLLEVLFGLMEFIMEEISSAASIDAEHDADPDQIIPQIIDGVVDQHLNDHSDSFVSSDTDHVRRSEVDRLDIESTLRKISLGDSRRTTGKHQTTGRNGTSHQPLTGTIATGLAGYGDQVSSWYSQNVDIQGSTEARRSVIDRTSSHVPLPSTASSSAPRYHSASAPLLPLPSRGTDLMSQPSASTFAHQSSVSPPSTDDGSVGALRDVDDEAARHSNQFDSLGLRSSGLTNGLQAQKTTSSSVSTVDGPTGMTASLNGQHTFTHHLYHHYDTAVDSTAPNRQHFLTSNLTNAHASSGGNLPAAHSLLNDTRLPFTSSHLSRITDTLTTDSSYVSLASKPPGNGSKITKTAELDYSLRTTNSLGPSTVATRSQLRPTSSEPVTLADRSHVSTRHGRETLPKTRGVKFEGSRSKAGVTQSAADTRMRPTVESSSRLRADAENEPSRVDAAGPRTYRDYLRKYYGDETLPQRTDASIDDAYLSDGCIDYGHDTRSLRDEITSFERDLNSCRERLQRKAKAVRFEDVLDSTAQGETGQLRRQFKAEDQKSRLKKEFLAKTYEDELHDIAAASTKELKTLSKSAKETESKFKKVILKPPQTARYKTNKFAKPVSVVKPRSRSRRRALGRDRKRSASASPDVGRSSQEKIPNSDLFPWLLEEFPFLHLSPAALHNMWRKGSHQLEQLSRAEAEVKRKKTKAQEQLEEAERRQQLLVDILHKEQLHRQRLKEAKDRQQLQLAARNSVRDRRMQSARVRKYYEEYQVRQRSRMLKKRTREELVFKRLFNDGLDIQKERIRELRKYAKDQRLERSKRQQQELEALENYYKDQFALLTESMQREKTDIKTREKAQNKVLVQMKNELRKKMEKEIAEFQRQLWQDEDDLYFRELDAEHARHELRAAQYKAQL